MAAFSRARRASAAAMSRTTSVIVPDHAIQVEPARLGDILHPLRRHRGTAPEPAADGSGHRRDRVGVPAVVDGIQDGGTRVAVVGEDESERHRKLLDRLRPRRQPGIHRHGAILVAHRVVRGDGGADDPAELARILRSARVPERGDGIEHGLDRGRRAVVRDTGRRRHDVGDRGVRRRGDRDRGGEDARGLPAVRPTGARP